MWRKLTIACALGAALCLLLLILTCTPWAIWPGNLLGYCLLIAALFLFLFIRLATLQLQKSWGMQFRSSLDAKSGGLKKELIKPGSKQIKEAALACCSRPRYFIGAGLLLLLFYLNYWLVFQDINLGSLPPLLFGLDEAGRINLDNVWLATCSVTVLLLAAVIIIQNRGIKINNRLVNRQNLIINAHSNITPAALGISLVNMDRMFLHASRLEYILNAKPLDKIRRPGAQAMLNPQITVKLNNDYAITEFYIKQLSIFADDLVIECDNYHKRFFQIFAVDNEFILNFFIKFRDADQHQLYERLAQAEELKIYYNFVIKNSFGVITDIYGSTSYGQAEPKEDGDLLYRPRESRANQYFYM